MKKLILLTLILIGSLSGFATHLMGGQITAEQISGLSYYVNLTLYRDVNGISISQTQTIDYKEVMGGNVFTVTAPHSGAVNLLNGVEEYTYTYLLTFPNPGPMK